MVRVLLPCAALLNAALACAATTPNLLVNGDAEMRQCTDDWTGQTSVPGWRVLRGAASVLCYAAFDWARTAIITPRHPGAGRALFAAPGADTAMEQRVDVSSARSGIDAGTAQFRLSGWLGGWEGRPEQATLTLTFLDDGGHATGSPAVIAQAGAAERGHATALLEREAVGKIPPGTRSMVVTLQFWSGMASFHNAYADNISLRLMGPEVAPDAWSPSVIAPPPSTVPALDHVFVVMMENTNHADVLHGRGRAVEVDRRMPFLASLAAHGVLLNNAWATYHPSDQNYVAMVAGDTFKQGPVYFPRFHLSANHLGDLLQAQGKTWRAYVQDMGTPCNLSSAGRGRRSFSPDDEPFVHFRNVIEDPSRCAEHVLDLNAMASDIASGRLPDFAWIAANNWWDGEGAWEEDRDVGFSNVMQDRFLHSTLDPLLASAAWRSSRSLVIITWDESNGWGWPDNHVPTLLVASPGLLHEGTVAYPHANGYDLLRTVESALRLGSLGRHDEFATPLNSIFVGATDADTAAGMLWPIGSAATRGGIGDTFGRAGTPAAAERGRPLRLVVPAGVDDAAYVNLEALGNVPKAGSVRYRFGPDRASIALPTGRLTPGFYGAWLRHAGEPAASAPLMVQVLPHSGLSPASPGVEIVGDDASPQALGRLALREGSNAIVRYCLPSYVRAPQAWLGVFPAGTSPHRMTQAHANHIGYWLKTPATGSGGRCGEAQAYTSELPPDQVQVVHLLVQDDQGHSMAVGRSGSFSVIPALPR